MGEAGAGFPYIMQHFALERLIMAINAHARAEYAIDYTIEYMSQREAFGKKNQQVSGIETYYGRACHRSRTLQSV
jgi:alkylation response protein AidB-like acyl-CoA dehydrogenase